MPSFGFDRLDTVAQTLVANQLYDRMWVYYNLFQPVMRLSQKSFSPKGEQATRVKRRYNQASTPFDRLCATTAINQERREQLQALRDRTNPRRLRQEIHDLMDRLLSLPGAAPGITEDVRQTLLTVSNSGAQVQKQDPLACSQVQTKEAASPVTLSFE